MVVFKVLIQGIIISVMLVYAPQFGLDDSQKDDLYDSLTDQFCSKFRGKGNCSYNRKV